MQTTKKVLVLGGCGAQGEQSVRHLAASELFSEIVIADIDEGKAQTLIAALGMGNVSFRRIDARDQEQIVSLMREADVVVNTIGPFDVYGVNAVRAAIEAKVSYVDINDEADATEQLFAGEFDALAKRANITVIVGLGISPGMTNLLAKLGSKRLDRVKAIRIMSLSTMATNGAAVWAHRLRLYSADAIILSAGRWVTVPPFSEAEQVDFLDLPVPVECYIVRSPEPVTIPRYLHGVEDVSVKMAYQPRQAMDFIRNAVRWGLTQENGINLRGLSISPLEFLASYASSGAANGFLALEQELPVFRKEILIAGEKDGRDAWEMFRCQYASGARVTGSLAAIGAEILASGKIRERGIFAPEAFDPEPFIEELASLGVTVKSTASNYAEGH